MSAQSRPAVRVIVTADDFGLSPAVDQGILDAFQRGVVRNTALLVNFPDVRESVERLASAEGLEVGIHLNLTAGPPVLPPHEVPSLLTSTGVFPGLPRFFARVATRRVKLAEATREWAAQLELGQRLGCRFTSITSHQHVHMLPSLAGVAVHLARQFGIPAVRLSRFHTASMFRPLRPKAVLLAPYGRAARRALAAGGIVHNDFVVEIAPRPHDATQQFCSMIRRLPAGVFEVVSHPGYIDPVLRQRDALVEHRSLDLAVLTAPEVGALWQDGTRALSTFGALVSERQAAVV